VSGWVKCFTETDFHDESIGSPYRGASELDRTVAIYARLSLRCIRAVSLLQHRTCRRRAGAAGTHKPLQFPWEPSLQNRQADERAVLRVFSLKNGKIQSSNCYPSGTVVLTQLGICRSLNRSSTSNASVA